MKDQCREYQERYGVSGMADDVRQHGLDCPDCREFARRQERLQEMVSAWKSPDVSEDFALTVMARIAEENGSRRSIIDRISGFFRLRLMVPLPVGVLATLLFILSVTLNLHYLNQSQPGIDSNPNIVISNPAPSSAPTPMVIPAMSGEGGSGFVLPSEWVGAGAFLLVPVVPPNSPFGFAKEPLLKDEDQEKQQI